MLMMSCCCNQICFDNHNLKSISSVKILTNDQYYLITNNKIIIIIIIIIIIEK